MTLLEFPMPRVAEDYTGRRNGTVVVVRRTQEKQNRNWLWDFRCDCGHEWKTLGSTIKQTCQCRFCAYKNTALYTSKHNLCEHPAYESWHAMKGRCKNKSHEAFHRYGGRGISVCEKWQTFLGFWEDMKDSWEAGLTLDRKDVNGNYDKENCRWATAREQAENRHSTRYIETPRGKMYVAQAAREFGIKEVTLRARLTRNVPYERLFEVVE